jgi:arsenite methyltransferase
MEQMAFDEKVAAQLDAFYRTRDVIHRRELALAALDVQPADAVVDIGCGPGFYVAALAEQAASVTGIDPSASMLAVAAHKTEQHRNVTLVEGEAIPLPLEEASMDRALSVHPTVRPWRLFAPVGLASRRAGMSESAWQR